VSGEWISDDKAPGWHETEVWVDLNSDGDIDTNTGDMIVIDRFYVEGRSTWLNWLIVIVGFVALTVGLMYISKQKIR
jgi:hypothetical protein